MKVSENKRAAKECLDSILVHKTPPFTIFECINNDFVIKDAYLKVVFCSCDKCLKWMKLTDDEKSDLKQWIIKTNKNVFLY